MAPRRQQQQQSQPTSRFASRGAFDVLAADDSDADDSPSESDNELVNSAVPTPPQNIVGTDSPARLTRTQQKKLAKEAREAKKAQRSGNAPPTPPAQKSSVPDEGVASQIADVAAGGPSAADKGPLATKTEPVVGIPARAVPSQQPLSQRAEPVQAAAAAAAAPSPAPAAPVAADPAPAASTSSKAPASTGLTNGRAQAAGVSKATTTPAPAQPIVALAEATDAEKVAAEKAAYWKKIQERTTFTFLMIFGFIGLISLGHPYIIILILVIQVLVYREVTALFEIPGRPSVTTGGVRRHILSRHNSTAGNIPRSVKKSADASKTAASRAAAAESAQASEDEEDLREEERKELLWSKTLSWYFFTVANYFLYGESLIYYFKHIVFVDSYFIPFARHHRFLSFLLYVIGFVGFVSGLRRENLKHQFGLFGWVHMSLLLIVFSSHFLVNNTLEGLIWLFVPASLVICNDVFAYVCGMIWGKTPLISLSPKKTREGFLGALVITEVFAIGWATYFQRFNYLICPAVSLGMNAFQDIQCTPNPVFQWHALVLPASVADLASSLLHTKITSIPYTPFQLHSLVMAAFASLVAPFGGFFASGFKRAFNIKDFGDSIPGHGGLTDRFDCQFLMGLFSYVYYSSLIREHHVTVGTVLQLVATQLGEKEQLEAYREIGRFLAARGIRV